MNTIVVDLREKNTLTIETDDFSITKDFIFNDFKLIIYSQYGKKEKWEIKNQEDGIVFQGLSSRDVFEGLNEGEGKSPPIKMYRDLEYSMQYGMVIAENGEFAHGKLAVPLSHIEWSKTTDWYERCFNTEYYYNLAVEFGTMIYGLMVYIMTESEKRNRQIKKKNGGTVINYQKKEYRPIDKKVFLLDDIISYVSDSYIPSAGHHEIQCPCWEVRGHYRHYKSGKVVFIPSYKKGKQRDTAKPKDKEYFV